MLWVGVGRCGGVWDVVGALDIVEACEMLCMCVRSCGGM